MFILEDNIFRALDGSETYELVGRLSYGPVQYCRKFDYHCEVTEIIEACKRNLANAGIEHVQIVDNLYWASATPDTHVSICDITSYRQKMYCASCREQDGNEFSVMYFADDDRDFLQKVNKEYPDCVVTKFGCCDNFDL